MRSKKTPGRAAVMVTVPAIGGGGRASPDADGVAGETGPELEGAGSAGIALLDVALGAAETIDGTDALVAGGED